MKIEDVEKYYKSTGYDASSLKVWLKSKQHNGYDESFDSSLLIVYFNGFSVVVAVSHVQFI